MAHSSALIKFADTGEIKYAIYNGTCDLMNKPYFDTREEAWGSDGWDHLEVDNSICEHTREKINIYKGKTHWTGTACRKCKCIITGLDKYSDNYRNEFDNMFILMNPDNEILYNQRKNEIEEAIKFDNHTFFEEGIPDWVSLFAEKNNIDLLFF